MSAKIIRLRPAPAPDVGKVHVWRHECYFEVIHESASGESYGPIEHYSLDRREEAVACALKWVRDNPPCILGDVAGAVL